MNLSNHHLALDVHRLHGLLNSAGQALGPARHARDVQEKDR